MLDKKTVSLLAIVAAALVVTACGEHQESSPTSDGVETIPDDIPASPISSEGEDSQSEDATLRTGHFLDAAVEGLAYATRSQQGVTDADGAYRFRDGETVSFFLGNPFQEIPLQDNSIAPSDAWKLGETSARELITPLDLLGIDIIDHRVVNIVRLLQTLDVDQNPGNGIEVPTDPASLPDGGLTPDFTLTVEAFASDPIVLDYIARATPLTGLVSASAARNHFQRTLNALIGNPLGSWVLAEASIDGDVVDRPGAGLDFESDTVMRARLDNAGIHGDVELRYRIEALTLQGSLSSVNLVLTGSDSAQVTSNVELTNLLESRLDGLLLQTLLGLDTRIRILPNAIQLESADRSVLLTYVRGEFDSDEVASHLSIEPSDSVTIRPGEVVQLVATASAPSSAEVAGVRFTWRSQAPAIATIDADGLVTAHAEGVATIMVSAAGLDASLQIVVSLPAEQPQPVNTDPPAVDDVTPETTEPDGDDEPIVLATPVDDENDPAVGEPDPTPNDCEGVRNVESVSQVNVEDDHRSDVEQSNESSIDQQSSSGECIPVDITTIVDSVTGEPVP